MYFVTRNDTDDSPTYVYKCHSESIAITVSQFLVRKFKTYAQVMTYPQFVELGNHWFENNQNDSKSALKRKLLARRWRDNADDVITEISDIGRAGWDTGKKRRFE